MDADKLRRLEEVYGVIEFVFVEDIMDHLKKRKNMMASK